MKLVAGIFLTLAYRMALVYWRIARPSTYGAFVAVWHEGRILAIKNSYKAQWSFPGGGVKSSETAIQAATRELREEVGIVVESSSLSLVDEFICHSEFKKDHATAFEITFDIEPTVQVDGLEVIEAKFIAFDEFLARRHEFTEPANCYLDWKSAKLS